MPVLLPPPTENDFRTRALEFWDRWNFPNCVGAIDGKHVRVVCPNQSGSLFYNYKNYFSIVLLAIVDAKYKFLAIDVGSYGKEGDSGIFAKSVMGKKIYTEQFGLPKDTQLPAGSDKCLPYVIVGDEAFRLHKRIMKPYSRAQAKEDIEKTIFNYRLSRARRVSENAFGLMSQIFRVFFTPIAIKPETCDLLIQATCCLHNLIRDGFEELNPQHCNQEIEEIQANMQPLARHGGFGNAEGFTVRDKFKSFFNEEGKLNWQNQVISRT